MLPLAIISLRISSKWHLEIQTSPLIPDKKKRKFPGGLKLLTILLTLIVLALVLIMLLVWKPWRANVKASDRVITVTGEATVTATPDEYVFSPSYDFTNADPGTAMSQMTTTSNQFVAKLEALGVPSKDIQTNSSGYSSSVNIPVPVPVSQDNGQYTYTDLFRRSPLMIMSILPKKFSITW